MPSEFSFKYDKRNSFAQADPRKYPNSYISEKSQVKSTSKVSNERFSLHLIFRNIFNFFVNIFEDFIIFNNSCGNFLSNSVFSKLLCFTITNEISYGSLRYPLSILPKKNPKKFKKSNCCHNWKLTRKGLGWRDLIPKFLQKSKTLYFHFK